MFPTILSRYLLEEKKTKPTTFFVPAATKKKAENTSEVFDKH